MDNNQKEDKKTVRNKKLLKIIIPIFAAVVVVSAAVAILNNYVLFPRIDKALANSLEAKFNIGTSFDVTDLFKKGKIELFADGVRHSDTESSDLDLSLSYGGKSAQGTLDFDGKHIDAVITQKGISASFSELESGERYGAYFEDIASALDGSFLNPENKAENALSRADYKKLLSVAQTLESSADKDGSDKKNALIVLSSVAKVFGESSVSDKEISYGGICVNGETRAARTVTFEFEKEDVVDLLERLETLFNSPSDKLREATESLLDNDALTKDIENLGYQLDTCEDLAKFIGSIKRLVGRMSDSEVKIEVAYVTNAVSAIVFECSIDKTTDVELLIDLGEKPKKDKTVYASLLVSKQHSKSQSERKYTFEYSVQSTKGVNAVSAVYATSSFIKDGYGEERKDGEHSFKMTLDTQKDTASFELERAQNAEINGEQTLSEKNSYSIGCSMQDSRSAISFSLVEVSVDGEKIYEPTGAVSLTLSKKPDRIELGGFTELLKMKLEDSDKLAGEARSAFEDIWESLGKLEPLTLKETK